jgi:hypothetical protein
MTGELVRTYLLRLLFTFDGPEFNNFGGRGKFYENFEWLSFLRNLDGC